MKLLGYKKTLFVALSLCIFLTRICWHGSEFCLHKIKTTLPYREDWTTKDSAYSFKDAWNQPYVYLGNGAQCYAFVSQDGKYVLKFFKMKHLTPKKWLKVLPFFKNYRSLKLNLRQQRLDETFGAFKIASEEFRNESGLLFVHLNPTRSLNQQICVEKKGKKWSIDLDQVPFILQERAELIFTRLTRLISEGDQEALGKAIASVVDFFARRDAKGLADLDSGVSRNYGFVEERVVQIDIGQLRHQEGLSETEKALCRRAENKFLEWAKQQKAPLSTKS